VLLYAPPNPQGLEMMQSLLLHMELYERYQAEWDLLPMHSNDLQASHLGIQLTDALIRVRHLQSDPLPVLFVGMDAPELPLDELERALQTPDMTVLCPSADGGYGMLSVPASVDPHQVFEGVVWSHSLTAVSQLKALTDRGVSVRLGRLMHDIDTPDDVHALVERLKLGNSTTTSNDNTNGAGTCLYKSTSSTGPHSMDCTHTRAALQSMNLLPAL
jgi:hypothetical protein